MKKKKISNITNTAQEIFNRTVKTQYQELQVTLSNNELYILVYRNHYGKQFCEKRICVENPHDINGNCLTQLPEDDFDLLDVVMYNEITSSDCPVNSPMKVFRFYLYFLVDNNGEWLPDMAEFEEEYDEIYSSGSDLSNSGMKYEPSWLYPIKSKDSPSFKRICGNGE